MRKPSGRPRALRDEGAWRMESPGATGERPGIAVIGMAAVFPGAGDLDTYWNNIVTGVDAIRDVSPQRLDPEFFQAVVPSDPGHPWTPASGDAREPRSHRLWPSRPGPAAVASDRIYCRRGGFVEEFATFDPTEFGIMPLTVDWAEPDQLMALRVAAEAVADAGGEDALGDRDRTGVVLGRGGYFTPGFARLDQRVKVATQLVTTLSEIVPTLNDRQLAEVRAAFTETLGPDRPEAAIGLVPNLAASRIANRLNLRGPAYTLDAACASSLIAVETAVRDLVEGRADAMIVGGVHLVQEVTFWSVFSLLGALSPSARMRPFDRRADGILLGEGVGMFVLKRLADAERAGDRVYAVIRGCGTSSDGRASTLVAPGLDGQVLAIERAWADAGLDPARREAVGLIEAHGTATPAGDAVELATLGRVFGSDAGLSPIAIGSVKSMIGHAMPAAGAAGLIKAVLALHHRTLPPTLHCEQPHPVLDGSRFTPVRQAAAWETDGLAPRRAGVNAFGFGGINAHVIVEETPQPSNSPSLAFPVPTSRAASGAVTPGQGPPATRRNNDRAAFGQGGIGSVYPAEASADAERVLLLAGASAADLARQLAVADAELLGRDDSTAPPSAGSWRLAIVAPTPRRLALARTVVERGKPWRGRNDLWFTPSPLLGDHSVTRTDGATGRGKLAFLFCGLEDGFSPNVDDVRDHFALPRRGSGSVAGPSGQRQRDHRGTRRTAERSDGQARPQVGEHAVTVVEVGRVLDEALRRMEIVPDLVGGHSIGEWNAMISAGLIGDEYADMLISTFDLDSHNMPAVVFGALGCGVPAAAEAIEGLPDVVISHDNCPHQTIICGEEGSVAAALDRLRGQGVLCRTLPFRSGFHSPFLEPHLTDSLTVANVATIPIGSPSVPVWSATTVAPYPEDPDGVRELFVRHMLEPVRFRELTERLYADGVRVFIQMGTGSVAGFIQDTLAGQTRRDHGSFAAPPEAEVPVSLAGNDCLTVVANSPKHPGLDQLRRVAAALWVEGASPRMDLLPGADRPRAACERPRQPGESGHARPAGHSRQMLLNLGAPLIRLGDRARSFPQDPAPSAGVPSMSAAGVDELTRYAADHPVLAEFSALVAETNEMVSAVVERWATGAPTVAGNPTAGADRAAPPAAARALEQAPAHAAAGEGTLRSVRRTMSIETMPYIIDHCFYPQPPGWPHVSDRFPVVPMTTVLEMMIDEVREFMPGRVVVGITDIRAFRWLVIEPPVEVTIIIAVGAPVPGAAGGPDAYRVTVEGFAQGTVLLADAYPAAPVPSGELLPDLRDEVVDGRSVYRSGEMFHGPGFQGLVSIGPFSPKGLHGEFVVTDAPGALLDTAGQLFGYWPIEYLSTDWVMLPSAIRSVRLYGPHPGVGERLSCTVWVRDVQDKFVTADLELRAADGAVWAVVEGWTDRRFSQDGVLWAMKLKPARNGIGERTGGGWVFVRERRDDLASRELVLRYYLDEEERARFAAELPRVGRQWLLGRIAAKDAVRHWLWDLGAGDVWGIEIGVDDAFGRPVVDRLPERDSVPGVPSPHLSFAQTGSVAVALVDAEGEVGIAIERVAPRGEEIDERGLGGSERSLLDEVAGAGADRRALWLSRFRAARTAVARAAARVDDPGHVGRPRAFVIDTVADGYLRVRMDDTDMPHERWVAHELINGLGERADGQANAASSGTGMDRRHADGHVAECYVVAWTSPEVERAARKDEGVRT